MRREEKVAEGTLALGGPSGALAPRLREPGTLARPGGRGGRLARPAHRRPPPRHRPPAAGAAGPPPAPPGGETRAWRSFAAPAGAPGETPSPSPARGAAPPTGATSASTAAPPRRRPGRSARRPGAGRRRRTHGRRGAWPKPSAAPRRAPRVRLEGG